MPPQIGMGCGASAQPAATVEEVQDTPENSDSKAALVSAPVLTRNTVHIAKIYNIKNKPETVSHTSKIRLAVHKKTEVSRALKCLPKKRTATEEFDREVSVLAALDHPNVLRAFETFEDHLNYYIVTELCMGGELLDTVATLESFTHQKAATIMSQVFRGLASCHARGVMHRDLRPGNLLLEQKAPVKDCVIKIIDFSSAKFFSQGEEFDELVGKAYYSSPEMLQGKYTALCDVWSCGVILHSLLLGFPDGPMENRGQELRLLKYLPFKFTPEDWQPLGKLARSCMEKMLCPEAERASASEMANTPWVTKQAVQEHDVQVSNAILSKMQDFSKMDKLQQKAMHVLAHRLNTPQIQQLQKVFSSLDKDKNGVITMEELRDGIKKLGMHHVPENLEALMNEMDGNGSQEIEYSEFLAAAMDKRVLEEESACWAAFHAFDADGSGSITKAELASVLQREDMQEFMDDGDVDAILKQNDVNKDGVISFEEFTKLMKSKSRR